MIDKVGPAVPTPDQQSMWAPDGRFVMSIASRMPMPERFDTGGPPLELLRKSENKSTPDQPASAWARTLSCMINIADQQFGRPVPRPDASEMRGNMFPDPSSHSYNGQGPSRETRSSQIDPGHRKMKSVKAAWDKASAGPRKKAALKHYQAAENAHTAHDDATTIKELDAAAHAMA